MQETSYSVDIGDKHLVITLGANDKATLSVDGDDYLLTYKTEGCVTTLYVDDQPAVTLLKYGDDLLVVQGSSVILRKE